nr:hypothetical protein [uncultured Rhodopila sp.]
MSGNEGPADNEDIADQLARLRSQIEQIAAERIRPAVSGAADDLNAMAKQQTEALAARVREQPLAAIAIAFGLGFLVGRAMR